MKTPLDKPDRQTVDRLIQRELDGVNSPDESAQLRRFIDSNPEARREYDCYNRIARAFALSPVADPPADLRARTLAAINGAMHHRGRPHRSSAMPAWMRRMLGGFRPRLVPVFMTGLALGAFAVWLLVPHAGMFHQYHLLDISHISGTMVPVQGTVDFVLIDSLQFDVSGTKGVARFYRGQDRHHTDHVVVDVDIQGPGDLDWRLHGRSPVVTGFRTLSGNVSGSFSPDGVRISHRGTSHAVLQCVLAGSPDRALAFAVSSGDIQLTGETVLDKGVR